MKRKTWKIMDTENAIQYIIGIRVFLENLIKAMQAIMNRYTIGCCVPHDQL